MTQEDIGARVARLEDTIFANRRTGEIGVIARLKRIELRLYAVNAMLAAISFLAGVFAQADHLFR